MPQRQASMSPAAILRRYAADPILIAPPTFLPPLYLPTAFIHPPSSLNCIRRFSLDYADAAAPRRAMLLMRERYA